MYRHVVAFAYPSASQKPALFLSGLALVMTATACRSVNDLPKRLSSPGELETTCSTSEVAVCTASKAGACNVSCFN